VRKGRRTLTREGGGLSMAEAMRDEEERRGEMRRWGMRIWW
jgi:hypothetical protein